MSQKGEDGNLQLVACRSRKLSQAEKNYPVHEKEMLALVDTLEEWRHYLLGSEVLVHTDNSALSYLQKNPRPSPRQVRWLERLQRYTLKITHVPGRHNVAADALSRYPVDTEGPTLSAMTIESPSNPNVPESAKLVKAGPKD